jgi:MFS family permease
LWSGALVALTLALSRGPAHGWGDPRVWPLLAASVLLFAGFARDEARSAHPLLPLDLLRGPLGVATTLTMLSNALGITVGFHLPLYLEDVVGLDAEATGRWLAVMPLLALVLAPLAGRWSDRLGARRLSVTGALIMAVGFGVLSRLGVPTQPGHVPGVVIAGIVLIGVGMGIFTVPNSSAALGSVPPQRLGLASGLQATMRNLGISAGAAAMAAIVSSRYAAHGGGTLAASAPGQARHGAFALATQDAYVAMTVVAIVTVLIAFRQEGATPAIPAPSGPDVVG